MEGVVKSFINYVKKTTFIKVSESWFDHNTTETLLEILTSETEESEYEEPEDSVLLL